MKFLVAGGLLTIGVIGSLITFSLMKDDITEQPSVAQEVMETAAINEVIDPNDELLAALADGADPSTVSDPTAAGGPVNGVGQPFDGLGGGGNGGGDPSTSGN